MTEATLGLFIDKYGQIPVHHGGTLGEVLVRLVQTDPGEVPLFSKGIVTWPVYYVDEGETGVLVVPAVREGVLQGMRVYVDLGSEVVAATYNVIEGEAFLNNVQRTEWG